MGKEKKGKKEKMCNINSGEIFEKLMHIAAKKDIAVKFALLQYHDGMIKGNRIAIRQDLPTIEDFNYNLAHELAHYFLHYDKGDTVNSDKYEEYEEEADRAANMLLMALSI